MTVSIWFRHAIAFGLVLLLCAGCASAELAEDSGEGAPPAVEEAPDQAVAPLPHQEAPQELPPPDQAGPVSVDAGVNPWIDTRDDAQSTFATDVDTASYALTRAAVEGGALPDPASVRVEEFVNALPGGYEAPAEGFRIQIDGTTSPLRSEPGARLVRIGLQAARPAGPRAPVALTFVVDTSGSMGDEGRLDLVRHSLDTLSQALDPDDRVAIVTFSSDATVMLPSTPAGDQQRIRDAIASLVPQESTNVEAGLRTGYRTALEGFVEGGTNRVILASDGIANAGLTDPAGLVEVIREHADGGITLVTVGVGTAGYSDALMERIADDGDGFATYVDSEVEARRLFADELAVIAETVALDTKVQVHFDPAGIERYRLLGYENRDVADEDFRNDAVDAGLFVAGQSTTALYEVIPVEGARTPWGEVRLRWTEPSSRTPREGAVRFDGSVLSAGGEYNAYLQLAAASAAYAEVLRGSPYAAAGLSDIAAEAADVAAALPEQAAVAEFARLMDLAAHLD